MIQQAGVTPRNPHQRWQFAVEVAGFETGFFTKCSGLDFDNELSRFAPGGSLFDQKVAGRMVFNPVTLEKGKSQEGIDSATLQWQQQIAQAALGTGGLPADYMRTVDIVEYDRTGVEIRRFRLHNAFPQKVRLGEYDGSSSEHTIEELTIEYQFSEQVL